MDSLWNSWPIWFLIMADPCSNSIYFWNWQGIFLPPLTLRWMLFYYLFLFLKVPGICTSIHWPQYAYSRMWIFSVLMPPIISVICLFIVFWIISRLIDLETRQIICNGSYNKNICSGLCILLILLQIVQLKIVSKFASLNHHKLFMKLCYFDYGGTVFGELESCNGYLLWSCTATFWSNIAWNWNARHLKIKFTWKFLLSTYLQGINYLLDDSS